MDNEVLKVIKNRRSTRKFKEEQITEEQLQAVLDAAVEAPSAINDQPWHFTVIQNKEMIDYISERSKEIMINSDNPKIQAWGKSMNNIFYNAPTMIVVSGREDVPSALVDCSAAIENMLIACESLGLGAVWIGLIRFFFSGAKEEEIVRLNIPKGYKPLYGVAMGYKNDEKVPQKPKRNRDVVNYIR